jgi:hypothetical protein
MPTALLRLVLVVIASISVAACGSASTPPVQVVSTPRVPTYAQVLLAMAAEQSVHMVVNLASGDVGDMQGNVAGDISGTVTFSGHGSFQLYARLIAATAGHIATSYYDMTPNAEFAAGCACHVAANKCIPFSSVEQTMTGLTADALAELFTPEGITHEVTAGAPAMTLQGNTIVDQQPVNIFKGSGREIDVPYGSKLPIRYVLVNGNAYTLTDWGTATPSAKPAACP